MDCLLKVSVLLLIFTLNISAVTVETKADWPSGERMLKYNLGHQNGGLKATVGGQYLTTDGTEDLTFYPNLSWQTPFGQLSASLSGRELVTSQKQSWRIGQCSWNCPQAGLFATLRQVSFPSGKEAQEWSCEYFGEKAWGAWGFSAFQQEAFVNQWGLPNREHLPWQRLQARELYATGQRSWLKWEGRQGYYWEWDRQESLYCGERTLLWTEATSSPIVLGPLVLAGKGRWQEAAYASSSFRVLSGEANLNFRGQLLPPVSIRLQGKKVRGSTPFLFDREWDKAELSLKSNLTGLLGAWEFFTRYDYLGRTWPECWLSSKTKLGPLSLDSRFYYAPAEQRFLRVVGTYGLNLPWGRAGLQLDYNYATGIWNNRGGQLSFPHFNFRYQNRAGYSPQWTGIVKGFRVQLSCDWWEDSQTLKVTLRPQIGNFEVSCWPGSKWQVVNRWTF